MKKFLKEGGYSVNILSGLKGGNLIIKVFPAD